MPSLHGSYPTAIIMWYRYITIHSATNGMYVNTYYCFIPKENDPKGFSPRNDTNTTKYDLTEKNFTMLYEWGNTIYTTLSNDRISPKDCDTQRFIIQNHYLSRYKARHSLISANQPNRFTHPIYLIDVNPTQLKLVLHSEQRNIYRL